MKTKLKVGVAGFGTIGRVVAQKLAAGLPGLCLHAISSGNQEKAQSALQALGLTVPVLNNEALALACDVIVECAPTPCFLAIAEPALQHQCTLVTVSGAATLTIGTGGVAEQYGGKIILATGALLGLDAVRAAAEGDIHSVSMVTRKPPRSLLKAKHVQDNNIDLTGITEPLQLFNGNAKQGAQAFPSNVNVAASLGLAGIGPELTSLEIWADPTVQRNTHTIVVDACSARLELKIENVPSEENPGTGKITALSVITALRSLAAPLRVGS